MLAGGCGSDPPPEPATPGPPSAAAEAEPERRTRGSAAAVPSGRLPNAPTAVDQAAIGALVETRAQALGSGRPSAYASASAPARREDDATDARRARRLGVRSVRIEGLGIRVRDGRAVASVRMSYRLARLAGRWNHIQVLRLRRAGRGGWRVTNVRSRAPRPPWELASYRRHGSRHFTVLAPEGLDPDGAGLGASLEAAYARIGERLPGRQRRRYPVVIAADFGDMAAMTSGIRDVGRLSAITDLSVRTAGPAERVTALLGVRILIPWPSFVALGPEARERVLTHELAHAVLAPATSGRAPAWLQEGIALYLSGDRRIDAARGAVAGGAGDLTASTSRLARLARPDAMAPLAGQELSAAYALSSGTAYYVAERFGPQRLFDLLAAFGDESLPGRAGPALNDRITRRILGVGARRLERDVGSWVRDGAPAMGG